MSQRDIIRVLRKHKKPMTVREINKHLDITIGNTSTALTKMLKYDEVECIEGNPNKWKIKNGY